MSLGGCKIIYDNCGFILRWLLMSREYRSIWGMLCLKINIINTLKIFLSVVEMLNAMSILVTINRIVYVLEKHRSFISKGNEEA